MSGNRWNEQFLNHTFWDGWHELIEFADKADVADATIPSDVQEVARLIKVIKYLDGLLDSCDPDIVPPTTWDNFNSQVNGCLQHVKGYISNENIAHIRNANSNLDQLLSYLRPYVAVKGNAAKSMSASLRHYQKTIDKTLNTFLVNATDVTSKIDDLNDRANELVSDIEDSNNKISSFEKRLFEGSDALEKIVVDTVDDIDSKQKKVDSYHERLLEELSGEDSIEFEIGKLRKDITEAKNIVEELATQTDNECAYLLEVYEKVHGLTLDSGEVKGGLINDIKDRERALDDFKKKQESRYSALNQQIEDLLPGATSAGLAEAYHTLKKELAFPIKFYSGLFYLSIAALLYVGYSVVTGDQVTNWYDFLKAAAQKAPLVLPIVWFALFVSKRRSEVNRLHQEYSHKKAIASSYEGFKKQVQDLSGESDELMKALLSESISAMAFNASTTLDKKHGDPTPLKEATEKLSELAKQVEKLQKVVNLS